MLIVWTSLESSTTDRRGCPAAIVQQHVATVTDVPPRQAPPDFNPQEMVHSVLKAAAERQGN
jgi:hypothetical protein